MSVTQAADFLDVPRGRVVTWVRRGELPCRRDGTRLRIPYDALVARREAIFEDAKRAVVEIMRISEELGLYELDEPRD